MADATRVYPGLNVTWPGATGGDDEPAADIVLAELDEYRPTAVESTQAGLRAFFSSREDRDAAASHLRSALSHCHVEPIDVPDEHWAERSQAALTAIRVGTLTVAPPWDMPDDPAGVIIIQPSMGFGTGHHASTRLCLRLLQEAPVARARVLDAGTGSGVLAIAAWKLGAVSVVAVDFDADAVTSARECAELNGVSRLIDIRQADLERDAAVPGEPFSLILANLTGGMLVRMAARLCRRTSPGGTLIVSGVTREEEADVTSAFRSASATLVTRLVEDSNDEWVGLRFTTP